MHFDFEPDLQSDAVQLWPVQDADLPALIQAASDPAIWADAGIEEMERPEDIAAYIDMLRQSGAPLVIFDRKRDQIIGMSRFYRSDDCGDGVAIGDSFLVRAHWGGQTNWAVKSLMLDHLFQVAPTAWFHIRPDNTRAQSAVLKLGAQRARDHLLTVQGRTILHKRFVVSQPIWEGVQRMRALRATSD